MQHQSISAEPWLATMSARQRQRWPTVDPTQLDDVVLDLWRDERLRAMLPEEAAEEWLRPVSRATGS